MRLAARAAWSPRWAGRVADHRGVRDGKRPARPPLPPSGPLDALPERVAAEALWWEGHRGGAARAPAAGPAGHPAETGVRPGGRVADRPGERQGGRADGGRQAGDGERIAAAGAVMRPVAWGMADHRAGRPASSHGRVDPAVAEAMQQAVAEAEQESSRTGTYCSGGSCRSWPPRTAGPGRVPSQRSSTGCWTSCRRAGTPSGRRAPAGRWPGARTGRSAGGRVGPGEWMQIDSTPVDVRVCWTTA